MTPRQTPPQKTLCVLGNSHMAAMVAAAEQEPERWPDLQLVPFGAHGDSLEQYQVHDGVLRSDDAQARERLMHLTGRDQLDLAQIDAFVLTGLQFSIFSVVRVYNQFSSMALPSVQNHVDALDRGAPLASRAMIEAYNRERFQATLGFRLGRALAEAGSAPVFIASQPRPAMAAMEHGYSYAGFSRLHSRADGKFVSREYDRLARDICEGAGLGYVPQPRETTVANIFTKHKYMRDSVRLARRVDLKHAKDDVLHANAAFGALMIDQVARALDLRIVEAG